MTRTTEDKTTATIEISAATCERKHEHRALLGQTCSSCSTFIPSLPGYSPDQFQRWFAPPAAEPAPSPYGPDPRNAALWLEYEGARQALEDATFHVSDLQRGRAQIVGRHVGADGNVVEDDGVRVRGARADEAIAEAVVQREKRREEAKAILAEIQKCDARRDALARRAMYLESYPEPEPRGVLERIGDAVRGS